MIKGQTQAVRQMKMAAEELRLACVEAAGGQVLLHIAFDREAQQTSPLRDELLMAQLRAIM